ncbi:MULTISPECIES: hypothetical protein [Yersinia]|uniref:hypothetical protein n=1 Tax=Yersinia TaxID=629 RepID=UPI0005DE3F53|nr:MULTISPECIES: hypothetical protein [Yersinia]ATM86022.1 hypothetical protein CRN74_07985 [Yersinia frederiksenii]MCB5316341.1 hypothetical protein [Yersinia massiliensis]CQH32972.1 Uncharacterised protein [Yersinia frederiksenii]
MKNKIVPVYIPAEIECRYIDSGRNIGIRFHYDLISPSKLPKDGILFTSLNLEMAKDLAAALQTYIDNASEIKPENQTH